MNLTSGAVFQNKYEILQTLGVGGMGTVFKARQQDSKSVVAIKIMHDIEVNDEENIKRFRREAKTLAQFQHKNIVTFYHFGIADDDTPFTVMEYLDGKSLNKVLEEAGDFLSPKRCSAIMIQVCQALSEAHSKGVMHRDIKPANIIILDKPEPDTVKVVDFGLAKLTAKSGLVTQNLTKTGILIGSLHYMSPEQSRGMPVDARSDVYSCGCIMYELIAGEKPFEADNPIGLLYKQANEIPRRFRETIHGKECPETFEMVCRKALEKDPQKRYQTMAEMVGDLQICCGANGTLLATAIPEESLTQNEMEKENPNPTKKKPKPMALVASVIFVSVIAALFAWKSGFLSKDEVVAAIVQQQLTAGPPATPWIDLAENQTGPKVTTWKLQQEQPHTGVWTIYLSSIGMIAANKKMSCTLVTRAPEWDVVMYNDKTRCYFLSPVSDWKGASLKRSTANTNAKQTQLVIEKAPKKIEDGKILGHSASHYLTDNLASTGLKKVEFWATPDVQAPPELKTVFSKIYGVGISKIDGLPLKVSYVDENGKRTPVFDTRKIEQCEIPKAYFSFPREYKSVPSEIEVLMDAKGRERMQKILDEESRSKETKDNVDDLLEGNK